MTSWRCDVKLKAGRLIRGGALFAALLPVTDTEPIAVYGADFQGKKEVPRAKNMLLWSIFKDILVGCAGPTPKQQATNLRHPASLRSD